MFLDLFIGSLLHLPFNRSLLEAPRAEASEVAAPVDTSGMSASSTPEFVPDDSLPICNCYLEVKKFVPNLPRTKDLKPNSPARPGAVAIYNYNGIPHYAYVLEVYNVGTYSHLEKGSNLKRCKLYTRVVDEEDSHLVGYWFPPEQ